MRNSISQKKAAPTGKRNGKASVGNKPTSPKSEAAEVPIESDESNSSGNSFDRAGQRQTYSGVANKDAIYRQLRKWGVKSPEDRATLTRAIQLASVRVTKSFPLPEAGEVILYNDRHTDPALADTDIIEFLRLAWGKWMKARVMTRKFFRDYDEAGERALRYWLVVHRQLPDDIHVPTIQQINDELIASGEALRSPRVAQMLATRLSRGRVILQP